MIRKRENVEGLASIRGASLASINSLAARSKVMGFSNKRRTLMESREASCFIVLSFNRASDEGSEVVTRRFPKRLARSLFRLLSEREWLKRESIWTWPP